MSIFSTNHADCQSESWISDDEILDLEITGLMEQGSILPATGYAPSDSPTEELPKYTPSPHHQAVMFPSLRKTPLRSKKSSDPYIESLRVAENGSNPAIQWFGTYNCSKEQNEQYEKDGTIPRLKLADLTDTEKLEIQYAVFKWEKEGCLHCHFVIVFHKARRAASVRAFAKHWLPQHLSVVKNLDASLKYIKKDATAVTEPVEIGNPPNPVGLPKGNQEFESWVKANGPSLCDIFGHPKFESIYCFRENMYRKFVSQNERPRYLDKMPEVRIYWGITGSGKSTAAYNEYGQNKRKTFIRSSKGKFFGEYIGQKTVIFQEYDPHKELALGQTSRLDLDVLLQILDRWMCSVEVKNGYAQMQADTFVFTSNRDPATWFTGDHQEAAFLRRITYIRHYYKPFDPLTGATFYKEYSGLAL